MKEHTKYVFHPQLEISRCGGGVLICYLLGNRISLFEESIDSDFSSFILKNKKLNKSFCIRDMIDFFPKNHKKYNFGKILYKLEKNGLINNIDDKKKNPLLFVNLTDVSGEEIFNISKEVSLGSRLVLINRDDDNLYKSLKKIKDSQVIFVMSDFHHKHKVSELNLYFFKKGIFWCPVILDTFGGYIGPLIHSVPSGPCFNCYEEKMYKPDMDAGQKFDLPVLLSIFLRVTFLEALKVGTNISPSQVIYSNLLEVDCFNHRSRQHYIYTNSNCSVCGI